MSDPVTEDEVYRIMLQVVEDAGPDGLTEEEIARRTEVVVDDLREMKVGGSVASLFESGLVNLHYHPEKGVVINTTMLGRNAAEAAQEISVEDMPPINTIEDEEEPPLPRDTVLGLTAAYWIDKWLGEESKGDANELIFFLAEHGYCINRMDENL